MAAPPPDDVRDWTPQQVAEWLTEACGVGAKVAAAVQKLQVDGEVLAELDDRGWAEVGVASAVTAARIRVRVRSLLEPPPHVPTGLVSWIPGVNVLYELVSSERPPDLFSIKSTLDTFALLAALFLTIAMMLPAGVETEEIEAARARFGSEPYARYGSGYLVVREFSSSVAAATYLLGSSLISTVIGLVAVLAMQSDLHERFGARARFWGWARWGVLWSIITLTFGVCATFVAFNRLVFIKVPDVALEGGDGLPMILGYQLFAYATLLGTLFAVFGVMGLGKRRASVYLRDQADAIAEYRAARTPVRYSVGALAGGRGSVQRLGAQPA